MFGNLIRRFPLEGLRRVQLSPAAAFTIFIAYGGGLWLHLVHEFEGTTEIGAPPSFVHWLRDSTLSLPLVFAGVWLALFVIRRFVEPRTTRLSPFMTGVTFALIIAGATSALVAAASPLHQLLIGGHIHGADELPIVFLIARNPSIPDGLRNLVLQAVPVLSHSIRDGLIALGANLVIVIGVMALMSEEPDTLSGIDPA